MGRGTADLLLQCQDLPTLRENFLPTSPSLPLAVSRSHCPLALQTLVQNPSQIPGRGSQVSPQEVPAQNPPGEAPAQAGLLGIHEHGWLCRAAAAAGRAPKERNSERLGCGAV